MPRTESPGNRSGIEPARLGVVEFGRQLILTGDLDPIYVAMHRSGLSREERMRWSLAYWCFYHAGVASRVADAPDFWGAMREADRDKWPRGAERRHFRGATSRDAIAYLARRFPRPESAVLAARGRTFAEVSAAIRVWPGFGPWIAFKAADMMERVLGVPVDFSGCSLSLYREPAAGAELVTRHYGLPPGVEIAACWLLDRLPGLKAPPGHDRPLNIQEVETVFCKWKSHLKGSYPPGKDTREILHGLKGWGATADRLASGLAGPSSRDEGPR